MSIVLGDNIEYKGKKPLDSRMLFDTIADMKAYSENYLPDITLAFNKEDSKMYVFNRENEVDTTTGKWREFEGGDGGTESVYLTQAEFNALTPAEQNDPTKDYYITSNGPVEGIKIEDLDDVEITNPTDGSVLSYNATSEKWENKEDINASKRQVVSVYSDANNPFNVEANTLYKASASQFLPDNVIPLVIIAGQSNADGRASYTTLNNRGTTKRIADNDYDVDNYFMRNNTSKTFNTYNVRTNNGSGPENGTESSGLDHYSFDPFFARYFTNTYNKPLYAVKMAVGGTPIGATRSRGIGTCTWNAKVGYFETLGETVDHYLCQDLLNKIKNIQQRAKTNNKTILPVAILWHQGETDGGSADTISTYKQNLSNVISYIRGMFGTPTLPFINAFIQKDYKPTYPQINSIYVTMNGEDDYMKTVDMEGHYTDIGDGLHYDGEALAYMGAKMFEYYKTFDLTFNDYNPGNWCDITSQFGNIRTNSRWISALFQNITTIEEFEALTPQEATSRSCVSGAIIWSDYKADYTKIRVTPIGSEKHFLISNRNVDDTLYSVWSNDWQSGQVVYDLTNATNGLIMSLNVYAALTDGTPLSNYFKIEVLSKY